jgi:hypothetical protein
MNIKTNKHGYVERIGCHMCKHRFEYCDYDSGIEYYCNLNGDRPKCGSVELKEQFDFDNNQKCDSEMDIWAKWEEENKIKPWGICNKFGVSAWQR